MRIIIVANGVFNNQFSIDKHDLVIAADGGLLNCLALGLTPHIAIGDMDSVENHQIKKLESIGVRFIRHSTRKDYTDLELALMYSQEQEADQVIMLAALGARWDQTLANLLLPTLYPELNIKIVDGSLEIFYLLENGELRIHGKPGDIVSIIPLNGDITGISTSGLEYTLENEILKFGSSRGISNVLVDTSARISINSGQLVCMVLHVEK